MDKDFLKGVKFALGILFVITSILGIVFAVGFHTASEILPGIFQGDYSFNGTINFSESTVTGITGLGAPASVQVFTSSGTWIKPTGISKIKVTLIGGGGGGGNGNAGTVGGGGGGGAGGTAIKWIDVTSISNVSVTVGTGGVGGDSSEAYTADDGDSGAISIFGSYINATGGSGGEAGWTDDASPGIGGQGYGGDINLSGGDGDWGSGGSGPTIAGRGGDSYLGFGGSGLKVVEAVQRVGGFGKGYGSGGGGAAQQGGAGASEGGNGADGIVIVEEYY